MSRRWRAMVALVALTLALFGPAASADAPPAGAGASAVCSWAGTWDTTYGTMVLTQVGDQVTGTYTYDDGRIEGTVAGSVLTGTWAEEDALPPSGIGYFEFTMATDCGSFSGRWRYLTDPDWSGWSGTKVMAFTAGPDQYVEVGSGPQTVPGWATGISAPPGVEWAFMVTTAEKALFSAWPDVGADGTLTFTPAPAARGTATVEVWMAYGYPDTVATAHQTFRIYIGVERTFLPCAFRTAG